MKPWYVYLLLCSDNSLYCGITPNLDDRLKKHNSKKASRYTRARLPVRLVYWEICANRSLASKREAQIKSLTREQKCTLMELSIES